MIHARPSVFINTHFVRYLLFILRPECLYIISLLLYIEIWRIKNVSHVSRIKSLEKKKNEITQQPYSTTNAVYRCEGSNMEPVYRLSGTWLFFSEKPSGDVDYDHCYNYIMYYYYIYTNFFFIVLTTLCTPPTKIVSASVASIYLLYFTAHYHSL